jgi:hypothetical protein
MENLLSALYKKPDAAVSGITKTAESQMLEQLQDGGQVVEENPYASMSDDELLKTASEVFSGDGEQEVEEEPDPILEKVAADALGGHIMAHSFWDELGHMKTAMVNGKCRVCKTNDMDQEGYSICTACLSEDDEEDDAAQQDS